MTDDAFNPEEAILPKREFGEYGGVNVSIEASTTFTVLHPETMPAIFSGERHAGHGCYLYGRSFNPTVQYLGRQLAALECTEAGYATSSGMAAISATLFQLCNAGDHIIASNAVYGGTFALLRTFLPAKCGISVTFVDISNLVAVRAAITPRTKAIYTETISNPTLVVADIPQLAEIAHQEGRTQDIKLVVDNTFSPTILTPARLGADVVLHSLTKFISGASDIIAGAICSSQEFVSSLMDLQTGPIMLLGPTMDPKVAHELSLRLPHLALRMAEHSRRALAFAERLHQAGAKVQYPGLPSHAQHALLGRLANPGRGAGGLLTLDLGSRRAAERFLERAQNKHGFGLVAVSLGYFETLLSVSGASTSSELAPQEQAEAGIAPGMVRMSVGLTGSLEQRWAQLHEAWRAIASNQPSAYRAAQVVRNGEGQLQRVASWDSHGSLLDGEAATEADAGPVDDGTTGGVDMGVARPMKVRKVGAKEIMYTSKIIVQ